MTDILTGKQVLALLAQDQYTGSAEMTNAQKAMEKALASAGCERLADFYRVGPVQRAAVESFVDALAQQGEQPKFAAELSALKAHIKEKKDDWVDHNSWNGDTESGFYTTEEVDMGALFSAIDEFGASLRKNAAAAPAAQPDNEADELLRNLGLEPEAYRTDGGYINHLKVKAAIRHPENYPQKCAHEWGNAPASLGGQICKHCGRPEPVEAAPAAQPVQVEQPTDTERLADMLIAHPESSHIRTAIYAELLLLSKQVGQLRKSNSDARKVIEQLLYCIGWWRDAYNITATSKEAAAIEAGQQWLKEHK